MLKPNVNKRLQMERNLWLATVRPNNTPHLVPIWFVWLNETVYLCTPLSSVKARNIENNSSVVFALEDGDNPLVINALAKILPDAPAQVVEAFQAKFDWDIREDAVHNAIIELVPTRVVLGE